ncbi:hypothetical protein SAMN05660909_01225 [Chitinophaga terrae (ex Kim and Jung 2007)]|uniref:Uncharacterized protein n=1 Tax=Chitinophaga terrae (ex Kim and Jung 2007) TaxID=408074 RepID=A0A1H3ZIR1_9BACT|nr:hypothetical protein [Chitinophaga terrae (ex Kim and Jung 2007)]GEP88754.1 hypothetical protein CTE07_03990 [Chitinophaga terrae (ex Kim and Jung 2007)]SEA23134.1 hypothetical protein SAMN05660909_01225 [Chitinophaga terrae (ex Kim and Jung 2007)]
MNAAKAATTGLALFFFLHSLFPYRSFARQQQSGLEQVLHFSRAGIRLDSLGAHVARETGIVFSFNAQRTNPGQEILLPQRTMTVKSLLEHLSKKYYLQYVISGNYVIIRNVPVPAGSGKKANNGAPAASVVKRRVPLTVSSPAPAAPAEKRPAIAKQLWKNPYRVDVQPLSQTLVSPVNVPTTLLRKPGMVIHSSAGYFQKTDTAFRRSVSFTQRPDTILPISSSVVAVSGRKEKDPMRLMITTGITADDVFYLSPAIHAGLPWLYAIAIWNTNFKVNGFSYGAGISRQLPGNWRLALNVTTGKLSADYANRPDTLGIMGQIRVKAQLSRLGIQAEKKLNNRLHICFGPVLNLLHSTYYYNGEESTLASNVMPGTDIDRTYYVIKPLYTLSNSYSSTSSSNNKLWIGFQAGLFWRLK